MERRTANRFRVSWPVTIKGADVEGRAFEEIATLHDLSSGGAFIYSSYAIPVGASLDVIIKIPFRKENWIKYTARIVRTECGGQRIGLAAQFNTYRPIFANAAS